MSFDPPRLLDSADAPPALREGLRAARAQRPSPAHMQHLAEGLGHKLSQQGLSASTGSGAGTWLGKVGLAALLGGFAALNWWPSARPAPERSPAAAAADEARPGGAVERRAATAPPEVPEAPEPAATEPPPASPAPASRRATRVAASREPRAAVPDELTLLTRAQDALASRPRRALRLTAAHQRAHRHGTFVQEREVIAIEALLEMGRPAQARARAAKFRRRYPRSGHLRRIRRLLAEP